MDIIGVIPARGGSKSIPKKSIAPCAGRPLLAYTCEAALASRHLKRVILSTDDAEIQRLGLALGVEAPFLRPRELAADDTPMVPVLRHVVDWLERAGENVQALVLLQPTSPLRQSRHIDEAVELFIDSGADSVVSVTEVPHQYNPVSVLRMQDGRVAPYLPSAEPLLRRQDKPRLYARNGPAVLAIRRETLARNELYGSDTRGYLMTRAESIDIDDAFDLLLAEAALNRR